MAKKEETAVAVSGAAAADAVPAVFNNEDGTQVSLAQILEQMKDADVGMEMTSDYLKIEDGESVRCMFVSMTEMAGMGEKKGTMVDAVRLLGADGRYKINADKVLVSLCHSLAKAGKANVLLQITSKGMIPGPSGKYRDLVINELNPKNK